MVDDDGFVIVMHGTAIWGYLKVAAAADARCTMIYNTMTAFDAPDHPHCTCKEHLAGNVYGVSTRRCNIKFCVPSRLVANYPELY